MKCHSLLQASAIALALSLAAGAALATGEVYYEPPNSTNVVFSYSFGHVPGIAIISASIRVNDTHWSFIEADGAIPIAIAQGSIDHMHTIIDFVDPQFESIVASVRLLSATDGVDSVTVGTLQVSEFGVHPLVCA